MATEVFDNVTQYGSKYAGLPAGQLSQAYANEFIAGLAEWPISMLTTKLGEKFVELVIGLGMSGFGFFGADRMGVSRRTKMDIHELAAHFLNRAADPDTREVIQMQEDLLDTVEAFKDDAPLAGKIKDMVVRESTELKDDLDEIAMNNTSLKANGIPIPDIFTKSFELPIGGGGVEAGPGQGPLTEPGPGPSTEGGLSDLKKSLSALDKASTEAEYLSEEEGIEIRGGF